MDQLAKFLVVGHAFAGVEIGNIATGNKGALSGPGENDYPHVIVCFSGGERLFQLFKGGDVEGVHHFGPIDGDPGLVVFDC